MGKKSEYTDRVKFCLDTFLSGRCFVCIHSISVGSQSTSFDTWVTGNKHMLGLEAKCQKKVIGCHWVSYFAFHAIYSYFPERNVSEPSTVTAMGFSCTSRM